MRPVKKLLRFLLLILFVSCAEKRTGELSELVKNSKEELEVIEKEQDTYEEKQFDFSGRSSQGGGIYLYTKDNVKKLIEVLLLGEHGKLWYKFYLLDDDKIYAIKTVYQYDASIYEGDVNIINQTETVYFLIRGKEYSITGGIKQSDEDIKNFYEDVLNAITP
jgi:hypothetical protein